MQPSSRLRPEAPMVALFAAVQFCHILDFVLMMPLGPKLMTELKITTEQFGLLVSSYSLSAALAGILVALLVDQFERRRTLFVLFSGFIVATLACGLAPNYPSLLASRIMAGCFGGVVGASVFAIMGDVIPPHRRGRAMGVVMSSFSVASVAGVPAGLALAAKWGWNAPFLALASVSVPVVASVFVVLPRLDFHLAPKSPAPADTAPPAKPLHSIAAFTTQLLGTALWRPHRLCLIMITFLMMSGFFIIPFIATLLVHNFGLQSEDLPLVYFFGGIGTVISAQIIGRCTDAFGQLPSLVVVTVLSLIPVTALCQEWFTEKASIYLLMTLFMMFVSGRMVPAMALVTAASDPKRRGTFMSLFTSVQAAAMGSAALLSGQIVAAEPTGRLGGFSWLGYLYIASSFAMLVAARPVAIWARQRGT